MVEQSIGLGFGELAVDRVTIWPSGIGMLRFYLADCSNVSLQMFGAGQVGQQ